MADRPTLREIALRCAEPEEGVGDLVVALEGMGFAVQSRYGQLTTWPVTRRAIIAIPEGVS